MRVAFEHARAVADGDADHPQRRFWTRDLVLPAERTSRWSVPRRGEERVNTNRVIDEAVHCAHNGWRHATLRYLCGPMRDGGGYQSTHALWSLVIAHENGCGLEEAASVAFRAADQSRLLVRMLGAPPTRAERKRA